MSCVRDRPALGIFLLGALLASIGCGAVESAGEDDLLVEPALSEAPMKADEVLASTELKLMVVEAGIEDARDVFKLKDKSAAARDVAFFDTADLSLYGGGLILRARDGRDGEDDTTVKVRPLDRADVDASWFELAGFKCEDDAIGDRVVSSCSLTAPADGGEIRDVLDGDREVRQIFSKDQERFLATFATLAYDLDGLVPLGPVPALKWKVKSKKLGGSFAVELWTLPDGRQFLECSIRSDHNEADATMARFREYLEDKGLALDPEPESKTRITLESLAAGLD